MKCWSLTQFKMVDCAISFDVTVVPLKLPSLFFFVFRKPLHLVQKCGPCLTVIGWLDDTSPLLTMLWKEILHILRLYKQINFRRKHNIGNVSCTTRTSQTPAQSIISNLENRIQHFISQQQSKLCKWKMDEWDLFSKL